MAYRKVIIGGSSGGGGGGASFTTIQVDAGTNPVASGSTDTLTLTGGVQGIILFTGDSATDKVTATIVAGSITNTQISNSAAIAYSKLNLATSIVNADIGAAAAIAFSKLASLSSANILVGSGGSVATAVAVSGDVTLANTGAITLVNASVTGQALTSLAAGTGAIAAADTILAAMGKAVASNSSSVTASTIAIYSGTGGHLVTPSTITASGSTLNMSNAGQIQFGSSNCTITNSSATLQIFFSGSGTPSATFDAASLTIAQASSSSVVLQLGGTTALASTIQLKGASSSGASGTNSLRIFPGSVTGSGAGIPGNASYEGGSSTSSNSSAVPGTSSLLGGVSTSASSAAKGGDAICTGGSTAGSGAGGDVILNGGTSGSGAAGIVQIGRTSTTNKNKLNNATSAPASGTLTLLNGPSGKSGDPTGYLLMTINGSDAVIPYW